jgi:hypothetical protein
MGIRLEVKYVIAAGFLILTASAVGLAEEDLVSDPHEILEAHYEAIGGLERLGSEETRYLEATVSIFGLEGTVKEWQQKPIRKRQEVDLGVLRQTTGDNGEYAWAVDTNGKLQIQKDEQTLSKREVEKRIALFEHLDRESQHFDLALGGTEEVNGVWCYVVRMTNTINEDVRTYYIGKDNFLMYKSILKEAEHESHTLFSDFRDVDGLRIAFQQDIELLPIGQKQVLTIVRYESNPEIDQALFEPPGSGPRDYRFTDGNSAENIPFAYIVDHLFIDVTIGCDTRTWIIDTGASVTVVDAAYAEELGLETAGKMKGYGAGTTVEAAFTELPAFSVKGIDFEPQKVAVLAIRELFERVGLDVVGILGYDFLSRFVVKIDYANQLLSFYDPAIFEYMGGGRVIDRPMKGRFFVVPMTVDGEYSGDWTLDIGAGGTSFFFPFAERNGLIERKGVEGLAGGAGGFHPNKSIKFETLEIAGYTLVDPLISVPLQTGGAFGSTEGTGNLGNSVLRHFVVYLDYERQHAVLEEGANFGRDFPEDRSGLALAVNAEDEIEVFYVSPRSPADRAGFKEGDIIRSVNRIPADLLDGVIAIRELLKAEAGTEYSFELDREGKTRNVKLKLRDLY